MKTTKKNGLEFYLLHYSQEQVDGERFKPAKKEYRWRIYSQGRIIAAATEGYTKLSGAANNIKSTLKAFGFSVGAYSVPDIKINGAIEAFKKKHK